MGVDFVSLTSLSGQGYECLTGSRGHWECDVRAGQPGSLLGGADG